jgi:hypothetical protein
MSLNQLLFQSLVGVATQEKVALVSGGGRLPGFLTLFPCWLYTLGVLDDFSSFAIAAFIFCAIIIGLTRLLQHKTRERLIPLKP